MKVKYIAFDSLGIKSSCFMLEAGRYKILVDPGIAGEVDSFPFSAAERSTFVRKYEADIRNACKSADVIVITHYHYDHYIPDKGLYTGKILLVKDPKKYINRSQAGRAEELLHGLDADVRVADGASFRFGKLRLSFSEPVWHGPEKTNLGYVIMLTAEHGGKKLFYSSDVNGVYLQQYADMIIHENPDIVLLDGPPTYLLGYIMSYYNLARCVLNICKIIDNTNPDLLFIDHHMLRDYRYPDFMYECGRHAKRKGMKLLTVAEYLGKKPMVLTGYEKNGPTRWKNWKRLDKKSIISIMQNAVDNNLVSRHWLDMAGKL